MLRNVYRALFLGLFLPFRGLHSHMFIPPPRDIMLSILRQKIDHMDNHIYNLLAIRLKLAEETVRFKTNITSPEREASIIERLSRKGRLDRALVEGMWTQIFEESRRLQEEKS